MPADWDGPFAVMWVPERFSSVDGFEMDGIWYLFYDDTNSLNDLSIFVWHSEQAPRINLDGFQEVSTESIQNSDAQIYFSKDRNIYMLLWTHDSYNIQIEGGQSLQEITKIAKNFNF